MPTLPSGAWGAAAIAAPGVSQAPVNQTRLFRASCWDLDFFNPRGAWERVL